MSARPHHHNTTGEQGDLLALLERQAAGQDAQALDAFRRHGAMSPSECHAKAFGPDVPLTSVRRAITNLTRAGLLVRTAMKVRGPYGRAEHVWRRA